MNMNKYGFKLFWSNEDKGYIATCPEFPTLSAFGETPETALAEAHIALDLFIEEFKEMNKSLPTPQAPNEFSGQFRVRLPKSLHKQLAEKAEAENVSLNSLVISYLSKAVAEYDNWSAKIQPTRKALSSITSILASGKNTTSTKIKDKRQRGKYLRA